MPDRYLQIVEPTDNVATALRELEDGETVTVGVDNEERTLEIAEDIIFGHKIAIQDIDAGKTITKYGKSIGNATEDIPAGTWVHVHNVESNYGRGDIADDDQSKVVSE